jgi:thiamine biosynthesis protein ThiS
MNTEKTISITANGDAFTIPSGQPLEAFLTKLGFAPGMVVVERNLEAVSPSEAAAVALADGDKLEIVRIVAGG